MSAKHTPGPWIGAGPSFGDPLPRYTTEIMTEDERDGEGHVSICEMPFHHHDDENEANARLIASAPSMLAELRSLRTLFKDQLDNFVESVTDPVTGLITDTDDRLSAEADQDRLNQIDAVIKLATGDDAPA